MASSWVRAARGSVSALVVTGLLALGAGPAHSAAPPAPVTDLAASLGVDGLSLTWAAGGDGTPVVRDITGLGPGYQPSDGRAVVATASSAYDTGFTNTVTRTYAVWAADADGTLSTAAAELTVGPLPAVPTATSLAALPSVVLAGRSLAVVGKITRAGLPFPGAKVALRSRVAGTSTESTVAYATSAVDGTLRATYTPQRTRSYRFAYAGDAYSAPSSSSSGVVSLQPRVTAAFSPATVQWKRSSTVSGTVVPNLAGRAVTVQRWYGGAWRSVARRTLSSTSRWSYVTAPAVGRYSYRAVLPGTAAYRSAASPATWLTVTPRTLYQGLSGPDVLALEKRLQSLKYYVGKVDGYFGYDTRHAVYAFQKVERLTATGTWRQAERTRVKAPRGFRLRHASSSSALVAEISITRQVMVLHRAGSVLRIVDVSTGSETYYYQDGVRYRAHTPRGVFRVERKIDGIRVSKLGELYRPSYWYRGWAIHGSGSVPTYPASHGCVRITNPVADLLFSTLAIGTKVAVYDE